MEITVEHLFLVASIVFNVFAALCVPLFMFMLKRLWDSIGRLSDAVDSLNKKALSMKDIDLAISQHELQCEEKRKNQ